MTPQFAKLFDSLPGTGWLTEGEAQFLYSLPISEIEKKDCLEVGCYHGRSSVLLASIFRWVHCVDPFFGFDSKDPKGDHAKKKHSQNMTERGLNNYTLYVEPIEEWLPQPVHFAYLDGDHTYDGTVRQIKAAMAARAKVIAIHDVNDKGEGAMVKDAAVKILGRWHSRCERIGLWIP